MYQGMLPKTGLGLAIGGATLTVLHVIWIGIALAVLGGLLVTLTKVGPRIALEPLPVGVRGSRLALTVNGRPLWWAGGHRVR